MMKFNSAPVTADPHEAIDAEELAQALKSVLPPSAFKATQGRDDAGPDVVGFVYSSQVDFDMRVGERESDATPAARPRAEADEPRTTADDGAMRKHDDRRKEEKRKEDEKKAAERTKEDARKRKDEERQKDDVGGKRHDRKKEEPKKHDRRKEEPKKHDRRKEESKKEKDRRKEERKRKERSASQRRAVGEVIDWLKRYALHGNDKMGPFDIDESRKLKWEKNGDLHKKIMRIRHVLRKKKQHARAT